MYKNIKLYPIEMKKKNFNQTYLFIYFLLILFIICFNFSFS